MKVYTNTGCSKCAMLKKWLDNKGFQYEELNIGENSDARDKLIENNRRSLPQVEIDGNFVDFKEYNDLLEYKGE